MADCNCTSCDCPCNKHAKKLASRYLAASYFGEMRALADKWGEKHPELRGRLEKALALTGSVTKKGPTLYAVESERQTYQVKITGKTSTCTCQDFVQRGIRCKHRLAVALVVTVEEGSAPYEPERYPPNVNEMESHFGGHDYMVMYVVDRDVVRILSVMDMENNYIALSRKELAKFVSKFQKEVQEKYLDSLIE